MAGPHFTTMREIRIGEMLFRLRTISGGVIGIGGRVLPARGLFETWVLTSKGMIDGHRKSPDATWQGTPEEIETLAAALLDLAAAVRANP